MTKAAFISFGACLMLCACATPRVLKAPVDAPTMASPSEANPIPAFGTPDPSPHATLPGDAPTPG